MKRDLPELHSEIIEPYLLKFCGVMLELIAIEPRLPTQEKWREWHHMLTGVWFLMDISFGIHARLTFGKMRYELSPIGFGDVFDPAKAEKIWQSAKAVIGARHSQATT